ncbi:heavy metal-associated isoprenylated plant protein 47-like [Humulus lupulus]|uniref:heavy metal-associated isoprenylated plant protein 47-like n=1 Tax=Humulus lupulus TaxID=3486 RepID=UPI002B413BD2|nr:heavy metal-associated isoprenylated plant protein 47-like [Humulus lupulus]
MTKTKMVMKVNMTHCEKCRIKAMKTASDGTGVSSVKISDGEKMEVIGEGIDPVCITRSLRKKFSLVRLESVEEVKDEEKKKKEEEEKRKKEEEERLKFCQKLWNDSPISDVSYYYTPHDQSGCSIM